MGMAGKLMPVRARLRSCNPTGCFDNVFDAALHNFASCISVTHSKATAKLQECRPQSSSWIKGEVCVDVGVQGSLQYRGPMDVMRQVVRGEGGVLGLYKGLLPTMVREVAGCSAMFAAYEAIKLATVKHQVLSVLHMCFTI